MTLHPSGCRRFLTALLIVVLTPAGSASLAAAATASGSVDPAGDAGLEQRLAEDQPLADDRAVLEVGHADLGPRFVDGVWRLLVHDDTAGSSVWRQPDRTVVWVRDAGRVDVPGDGSYGFLGAEPGSSVYLIPQVQLPEVIWLGWNTQDPEVMDRIERGVSLTLVGHEGPGRLTVYLQGGNFAEPDVLWSSAATEPSPIWVETNTHTHANWVFTEPGVHLLAIRADATLLGGEQVSDTAVVRVAVGDSTDTDDAFVREPSEGLGAVLIGPAESTAELADGPAGVAASASDAGTAWWVVLVAAVALGVAVGIVAWRSNRARRLVS